MELKHYVITRFLCDPGIGLGDKIFKPETIEKAIEYVKSYFMPTLENQTQKDFTIIFIINDEHHTDAEPLKKLTRLETDISYYILKHGEYMNFIGKDSDGADCVILTCMDYDDLVKSTAAEEVRKISESCGTDVATYGYDKGYVMREEGGIWDFAERGYTKNRSGYMSVFYSIIFKGENAQHAIRSVNDIYAYAHTLISSKMKIFAESHKLRFRQYRAGKEPSFVWVRHEGTGTELLSGTSVFSKDFMRKQIDEAPAGFKSRFGVEPHISVNANPIIKHRSTHNNNTVKAQKGFWFI